MIPCKLYIIGLELLLLAYTVQSFVMLTANIEDIKKLAGNFVSDSFANQIAEFVVTATQEMNKQVVDVSEDNDLVIPDISDDNDNYKLKIDQEKQRENEERAERMGPDVRDDNEYQNAYLETTTKLFRDTYTYKNSNTKESFNNQNINVYGDTTRDIYIMDYKKDKENILQYNDESAEAAPMIDWQKEKYEESREKNTVEQQSKQNNKRFSKQDYNSPHLRDPSKGDKEYNPYTKDIVTKENEEYNPFTKDIETKDNEEYNPYTKDIGITNNEEYNPFTKDLKTKDNEEYNPFKKVIVTKDNEKYNPFKKDMLLDFKDKPSPGYKNIKNREQNRKPALRFETVTARTFSARSMASKTIQSNRLRELRKVSSDLTTKKEKTDFDQYDNRNYPKSPYVATSGLVKLPVVRSDTATSLAGWWEKEMPEGVDEKQTWF